MADLIDCDALMADIATSVVFSGRTSRNAEMRGANKIIDRIKAAPTVDAVEVVRCRECKHLNVLNRKELYAQCPKTNTVFLPFKLDTREHFCSLGERKGGDGNG